MSEAKPVLNAADADHLARIERGVQYGVTIKDLKWLVLLARRLERTIAKTQVGSGERK